LLPENIHQYTTKTQIHEQDINKTGLVILYTKKFSIVILQVKELCFNNQTLVKKIFHRSEALALAVLNLQILLPEYY
jgi:hypothetical protein